MVSVKVRLRSRDSGVSSPSGVLADESVHLRHALEEVGRHAQMREGVADFLHLADPAAGARWHGGDGAFHPLNDGLLARLELGKQRLGEAHQLSGHEQLGVEGPGAFGHGCVAHLDAGSLPHVAVQFQHGDAEVVKPLEFRSVLAGGVEVRTVARARSGRR